MGVYKELLEALHVVRRQQRLHLRDGDAVEGGESFGLWQALADEDGVKAFEVGEDNQLLQRRVVADVALGIGMGVPPLFGGLAEEGDIEHVRLAGIDGRGLRPGDGGRDERFLDGIRVDAVVDLGEGALEVPLELEAVIFIIFEALELDNQVELELRRNPRGEFKGDVPVGKGAPVAA